MQALLRMRLLPQEGELANSCRIIGRGFSVSPNDFAVGFADLGEQGKVLQRFGVPDW